jgi:hypothetical protein
MEPRSVGLLIVAIGVAAVLVGVAVYFGAFGWFGNLPGDIRIETENTRVFIPITSMLVLSIALSALLSLLRNFF